MKKQFMSGYALVVTISIAIMTIGIIPFIPDSSSHPALNSRITTALAIGTLVALLWYTFETYRMQKSVTLQAKVTAHQIEMSVMPRLVAERQYGSKESFMKLSNIGNGVAVNVRIDPVILNEEFGIKLEFEPTLYIRPGDSCVTRIINSSGGTRTDFPFDAHLEQRYANREVMIHIRYENVSGDSYQQSMLLGRDFPVIGNSEVI